MSDKVCGALDGMQSTDVYWVEGNTTNPRMLEIARNQGYNQALSDAKTTIKNLLDGHKEGMTHHANNVDNLLDQLEIEMGIVYSDGHFRKMYKGMWGADDAVMEAEKVGRVKALEGVLSVLHRHALETKDLQSLDMIENLQKQIISELHGDI